MLGTHRASPFHPGCKEGEIGCRWGDKMPTTVVGLGFAEIMEELVFVDIGDDIHGLEESAHMFQSGNFIGPSGLWENTDGGG